MLFQVLVELLFLVVTWSRIAKSTLQFFNLFCKETVFNSEALSHGQDNVDFDGGSVADGILVPPIDDQDGHLMPAWHHKHPLHTHHPAPPDHRHTFPPAPRSLPRHTHAHLVLVLPSDTPSPALHQHFDAVRPHLHALPVHRSHHLNYILTRLSPISLALALHPRPPSLLTQCPIRPLPFVSNTLLRPLSRRLSPPLPAPLRRTHLVPSPVGKHRDLPRNQRTHAHFSPLFLTPRLTPAHRSFSFLPLSLFLFYCCVQWVRARALARAAVPLQPRAPHCPLNLDQRQLQPSSHLCQQPPPPFVLAPFLGPPHVCLSQLLHPLALLFLYPLPPPSRH
eukprot:910196-Rhodomonas_salina.1